IQSAIVEVQLVAQTGTTTRLDLDAQREVVAPFLVEQILDLARGGLSQDDAVPLGGDVYLNRHAVCLPSKSAVIGSRGQRDRPGRIFQCPARRLPTPAPWSHSPRRAAASAGRTGVG